MADFQRFAAALADRYTVEREVGHGGMATVYLAQDRKHDRPLAIKVLRPELAAAVGPERFLREIEIAARLNHPHILPLYDSGEAAGSLYYVMPYVEGETLRQRLDREGQLSVAEAVRIACEAADGLNHAHRHGVIHRDIKPENILMSGGHAVIADFGIARAISAAGGEKLTETGLAIGTPAYMSPEQSLGQSALDARSDLYSLACVLYEMLAGEPPHAGPTAQVIIGKRMSGLVPSVRDTRDTVSQELDAVVRRGLARAPADRFGTVAELGAALTRATTGPDWVARPTGPLRVMGLYLLSSLAVLGLVQVVVSQIGLPSWVVPGAIALLLIGVPIILGTTLVQRGSLSVPRPALHLLTWRRAILGGVVALGAWGVIVTAYMVSRGGSRAVLAPTRLAVLPFLVRGDSEFAYLGEGIVDLLARNLDGAGDLRTVDPGTVLSALGRDGNRSGDADRYRVVARRVGAGIYVLGTVHAIAGRLRIQASLYDASTDEPAVALAQFEVEGEANDALALIDQLAAKLLVDRRAAPGLLFETATLTTRSLPALKAYLTAEHSLRSGPEGIDSALAGLQRAVTEDSTFALAHYRLAVAAGWQGRQELAANATAAALRHSPRLAERDRRLLEAYDQYRNGSVEQAEQGFRNLVRDYPDDLEAQFQLAVREEDYSGVDAMLARYRGRPPLSLRLLPAAARSDTAAMRALLDEGRALESRQLQIAGRYAASYLEDFALADSLARLDLQWRERPANRAAAQLLLAGLAAASGRWTAAREAFRTAATIEGTGTPLVQLAMAATLPLQPVPTDDLRTIHQVVTQWDPSATQSGPSLTSALQPHLRHYLLGLLSSRLGDHQAAERAASTIENLPAPPRGAAVAASLAATVRADVAWMQNRHRDILPTLDRATARIPLELIAVSRAAHVREYGLEHARYLRAVALGALGRDSGALTWLRFGLRGAPQEYLYHAPIHIGLGNVFERLGHADSAAHHYRRFLELWSRADSAASPVVSDVRRRLAPIAGNSNPPRRSGFD